MPFFSETFHVSRFTFHELLDCLFRTQSRVARAISTSSSTPDHIAGQWCAFFADLHRVAGSEVHGRFIAQGVEP